MEKTPTIRPQREQCADCSGALEEIVVLQNAQWQVSYRPHVHFASTSRGLRATIGHEKQSCSLFCRCRVRAAPACRLQYRFTDSNQIAPFDYRTINPIPVGLVQARSEGAAVIPPLSADTPIVYRITLISGAVGIEGQTTFTETEIGRSNAITPFL